jgi:hypothetical protein
MKEFIEKIVQTLKSNGFPGKRVSLPTDKMYEAADNKGLSFNSVLEKMKAEHNIEAQIGPEKIIFSQIVVQEETAMDPQELMRQAQEMMAQMDPAELKRIQEMFSNMSPEEKQEIIKKGKDLGII